MPYHSKEGWEFERNGDGSVDLWNSLDGTFGGQKAKVKVHFTAGEWVKILWRMGDTDVSSDGREKLARQLHGEKGEHMTEVKGLAPAPEGQEWHIEEQGVDYIGVVARIRTRPIEKVMVELSRAFVEETAREFKTTSRALESCGVLLSIEGYRDWNGSTRFETLCTAPKGHIGDHHA